MAEPGKSKKGYWIAAAVVVMILIGRSQLQERERRMKPSAPVMGENVVASEVAQPTGPTAPAVQVNAVKLWSDYHDNEVAADDRYKGRLLLVDGLVASIAKDGLDRIIVRLKSPNEFMNTDAYVRNAEKAAAASLRKGQKVQLLCRGGTMMVGSPTLKDCAFH